MIIHTTADECSDLITTYNLQNVKLTPQTSFAGETIKIACMDGHEYNDSSIEKYSTCRANDTQWTYEPFDCLRKFILLHETSQQFTVIPNHVVDYINYYMIAYILVILSLSIYFILAHTILHIHSTTAIIPQHVLLQENYSVFVAKLCPPVYNISHCNISTTDNWYPTEVNFTCTDGYFFPDGSLSRLSMCNKYGRWSEVIPQCTGMLYLCTCMCVQLVFWYPLFFIALS